MTDPATPVPELYGAYRDALDRGDFGAAVDAAVRIDDAAASRTDLLDDFASAVRAGDRQLATTLLLELDDRFESRTAAERERIQRAVAAAETTRLSAEERSALLELPRRSSQVNANRSSFLSRAIGYLEAEDGDGETVARTAEQTRDTEREFGETERRVEQTTESVTVESAPVLLGVDTPEGVVVGDAVSLTVTVGNAGDARTDPLELRVASTTGVSVDRRVASLDPVAPTDRAETTVDAATDAVGEGRVEFELRREETVVDSLTASFSVARTASSIRAAITGEADATLDSAELRRAISYWANDEPVPRTGGDTISTERIQTFVTEWVRNEDVR